jgi:hypothetical protein
MNTRMIQSPLRGTKGAVHIIFIIFLSIISIELVLFGIPEHTIPQDIPISTHDDSHMPPIISFYS